VIPKNVTLKPKAPVTVPEGTVSEADQKIAVADAGGTKSVAVADTAMVIDKPAFDKALKGSDGFFHDWRGTVTAGAAFVAATQNSRTFKEAIAVVRTEPGEDWPGGTAPARIFGFGQALFDHSFSQGINLQQTYVGGIGWRVFGNAKHSLDLKAGVSYINQQLSGLKSTSLEGSAFDEKYVRHFRKALFTQELAINPSWTNSKALSGIASAGLSPYR